MASIKPDRGAQRAEVVTAKNVQRGLAQKVQEASAQFRKKQRVYMQSGWWRGYRQPAAPG